MKSLRKFLRLNIWSLFSSTAQERPYRVWHVTTSTLQRLLALLPVCCTRTYPTKNSAKTEISTLITIWSDVWNMKWPKDKKQKKMTEVTLIQTLLHIGERGASWAETSLHSHSLPRCYHSWMCSAGSSQMLARLWPCWYSPWKGKNGLQVEQ
jgi:hypothetical protein